MEYRNYMEVVIREILDDILAKQKVKCKCDRCKMDMIALALNKMPPGYCVSDAGCARVKLETIKAQFQVDVIRELTIAIEKVGNNPRH